jgi:hypothetical protein
LDPNTRSLLRAAAHDCDGAAKQRRELEVSERTGPLRRPG